MEVSFNSKLLLSIVENPVVTWLSPNLNPRATNPDLFSRDLPFFTFFWGPHPAPGADVSALQLAEITAKFDLS
jgi:hypothetical protein